MMLEIKDLEVSSDGKKILKGVNVRIGPGETCVLLGPNGSGKSTLLHAIVGNPKFRVDGGAIYFKGKDILGMPTNERIKLGLGTSFQYPPAVRGVKLSDLLEEITGAERVEEIADKMGLRDFLRRDLNLGFSGGELKRSEIAQLLALEPSLILLDEPDSGVDIENLELIGEVINELLQRESRPRYRERSGLIITHMGSIMQYVKADRGFVMVDGKIACCGNPEELISQIKKNGYGECMKCVD
jgi:Fe-S cluster assembly ATP-binding protein